ncbi:MAG TPA: T9SS type A sorting domain-containing protein [Chitinophagaceae bacterium]|nr:T9SS type A sorting domain-containing protein [Chitinophagaceae bacterium]
MKTLVLFLFAALLSFTAKAQTYTTVSSGNWNSSSTWGGTAPGSTLNAGVVVNVKHAVTYNLGNDLNISGTLNISGDTLRTGGGFNKNIKVNTGGTLKVINGGLLQSMQSSNSTLESERGTVIFTNAKVTISKDFENIRGGYRSIKNSTLIIGGNYDLGGEVLYPAVDSIQFSVIETNTLSNGEFRVKDFTTLRVANAYIKIQNGSKFKNESLATIITIPGANGNFGFDYLRITDELKNDGTWNARIDAACVSGSIVGLKMSEIDFTRNQDCSATPLIGAAPELTFTNPVLVSGTANQQGAIYRFANVSTGVDAQIRLKKFSRNDIVMQNIDLPSLGWGKSFQPQFGLAGNVQSNQSWYIDFEIKFYEAGTNTIKVMPKVDMTALDVDGDGVSIRENVSFQNPSNVTYSTVNSLTEQAPNLLGQLYTCPVDASNSLLISCPDCGGDGKTGTWGLTDCSHCNATGILHAGCNHAFEGVNAKVVNGPVTNFVNIDTAATQVMAVYQYTDRSVINFRYGAKSGSSGSNAGIRLNSLWFRQFSLAPVINITLPVKLSSFTATLNNSSNRVDLKWVTASEINVSHFVIEKSLDGTNFSDAGLIFAYGNATDKTNYIFPDNLAGTTASIVYYRLRSVDIDGKMQYSETRIIRLTQQNGSAISILTYPNPVKNELRMTIPADWQNKAVVYELFNMSGQAVKRNQTSSSSQTETMNIADVAPGLYIVRVSCEGVTAQQKIVKQ